MERSHVGREFHARARSMSCITWTSVCVAEVTSKRVCVLAHAMLFR